ncbi:MAG: hypothetical protein J6S85_00040 [Methanobrevibacter sp.]|nr:hypothetical protein [Methanobrevibacter sp.]
MRKLNNKELTALQKLSEVEKTFLECIDIIAGTIPEEKDAFYFSALSSLSYQLINKLQEDEMHVLGRVYSHIMKFKREGMNNERFN